MRTNLLAFLSVSLLVLPASSVKAQTPSATPPASRLLVLYSEGKPAGTIELPAGGIRVSSARAVKQRGDTIRFSGNVTITIQQSNKTLVTIKTEDAVLMPSGSASQTL